MFSQKIFQGIRSLSTETFVYSLHMELNSLKRENKFFIFVVRDRLESAYARRGLCQMCAIVYRGRGNQKLLDLGIHTFWIVPTKNVISFFLNVLAYEMLCL